MRDAEGGTMAKNITVRLEHKPGALAALGETLGRAGVNIEGISAVSCEGMGVINILVEEPARARDALADSDFEILDERDVLVVSIEDRPGELGGIARQLAKASVNINLLYLTAGMDLVIGVDDFEKARCALSGS